MYNEGIRPLKSISCKSWLISEAHHIYMHSNAAFRSRITVKFYDSFVDLFCKVTSNVNVHICTHLVVRLLEFVVLIAHHTLGPTHAKPLTMFFASSLTQKSECRAFFHRQLVKASGLRRTQAKMTQMTCLATIILISWESSITIGGGTVLMMRHSFSAINFCVLPYSPRSWLWQYAIAGEYPISMQELGV